MISETHIADGKKWLKKQIENLTDTLEILLPSEYSEKVRYLPPQVSALSGPYRYDVAPYLREIVDCFSPQSPVQEVAFMKGVQLGATVGVLENVILYYIGHVCDVPVALVYPDDGLAQNRIDLYLTPMLLHSGLDDRIQSMDEKNTRKTGKTRKKIEWIGGGFMVPLGAQSPLKFRSLSFQVMLCDELDAWPDRAGKGDACDTVRGRSAAYETSRKLAWISTPLVTQTSKILKAYDKGDRRKFHVPCKHCGEFQEIEFNKTDHDGEIYGIHFSVDDKARLATDSVVLVCKYCRGKMINEDKAVILPRGKWVPTTTAVNENYRSYHLSAFYSPVGMQSWEVLVARWLECWNPLTNKPRDTEKLQVFYNEVLGAPYTLGGQRLKKETVETHRRVIYNSGEIPNIKALEEVGGKIQFLTAGVDVHKEHLDIQVIGWAARGCFYSIEWLRLEGDCEDLAGEPWIKLQDLVENKQYKADDGRTYRIQLTFIDSQYNTDLVHRFCSEYTAGVFPVRGTELPTRGSTFKEFSDFTSKMGQRGYNITTTLYKDRLALALKKDWTGVGLQPDRHPNFPNDYPDQFFKELVLERKQEIKDSKTGKLIGYLWVGRGAHAWDTLVYNTAAADIIALDTCINELGLDEVDPVAFWDICEKKALFFER